MGQLGFGFGCSARSVEHTRRAAEEELFLDADPHELFVGGATAGSLFERERYGLGAAAGGTAQVISRGLLVSFVRGDAKQAPQGALCFGIWRT